jgi:hypothetical protein
MKLYVTEIRKDYGGVSYQKISVWTPNIRYPPAWEFSSNKARLVCELLSRQGKPILSFNEGLLVELDVDEEIVDIIDKLSRIRRNFTRPIYERLSSVVHDYYKFVEELAPYLLELELEDSGRR